MSAPPDHAALIEELRHPHSVQPYSTQRQVRDLLNRAAAALAAQARRIEDLQVMLLSSDQRAEEVERELAEVKELFDESPAPGGIAERIAALPDKERAQRYLEVIRGQGLSMRAMTHENDVQARRIEELERKLYFYRRLEEARAQVPDWEKLWSEAVARAEKAERERDAARADDGSCQ